MLDRLTRHLDLRNATFLLSLVMFGWLVWYFYTGAGGPRELATNLVPVALLLQILFMYRQSYLYPRLPAHVNHVIVAVYAAICVYGFQYFYVNFEEIAIYRHALCEMCHDEDDLAEEIYVTVIHEVAHAAGIDDGRLHELGWA